VVVRLLTIIFTLFLACGDDSSGVDASGLDASTTDADTDAHDAEADATRDDADVDAEMRDSGNDVGTGLPSDVLFVSDWGSGLGTDESALRDMDKSRPWSLRGGNGRLNEVIASDGLEFPTPNVLQVTVNAAGQADMVRYTELALPEVDASLYYRWYVRVVAPNGLADPATHPIQDGNAASQANWLFRIDTSPTDTWRMSFEVDGGSTPAIPRNEASPWFGRNISFAKDETYRFELRLHRISDSQFNLHARVYDSTGTLIADDDDFPAPGGTTLADEPALDFIDVANLDGLNAGINGLTDSPGDTLMYYEGGVLVRTEDWPGPYNPAEADF